MGHTIRSLSCVASILALLPAIAEAQADTLSASVRTGEQIVVTASGRSVAGTLIDVSDTKLRMWAERAVREIDTAEVTKVERERPSTKRGAVIGFAAGILAVGLPVAIAAERECGPVRGTVHACDDEWGFTGTLLLAGVPAGGLGAGIGAVIGHFIKHRETVFKPSSPQALRP